MGRAALFASLAVGSLAALVWLTTSGPGHAPRPSGLAPERPAAAPSDAGGAAPPVALPEHAAERVEVASPAGTRPDDARGRGQLVITCAAVRDATEDTDASLRVPGRFCYQPIGPTDGRELTLEHATVAEGHRSAPLPSGEWLVELRAPGYQPHVERVSLPSGAIGECTYRATLTRGEDVEFDVRLPDGTQPERALFAFVLRDKGESRAAFVPRADELMTSPTGLWTREEPRITVERTAGVNATDLLFAAEPTRGSPYDARAACRYVSRAIAVHPPRPGKVRVDLFEAAGLTYTLRRPAAPLIEQRIDVHAVRLDGCEGYDVGALLAGTVDIEDWPAELIGRDSFAFEATSIQPGAFEAKSIQPGAFEAKSIQPGAFEAKSIQPGALEAKSIQPSTLEAKSPVPSEIDTLTSPYLEPGRWLIVAGWRGDAPSATATVELEPGANVVELTLGEPSTARWIRARFFVDGKPVSVPSSHLDFALVVPGDLVVPGRAPASRAVRDRGLRGGGGLWFLRDDLASALADLTREAGPGPAVHLVAYHGVHAGFVSGPLHTSDAELTLTSYEPAAVTVEPARPRTQPITVELEGRPLAPTLESRLVALASGLAEGLERPAHLRFVVGPTGPRSRSLRSLATGRWRFEVRLPGRPEVTLPPIELDLGPGPRSLTVELPD